jgi:diguanylate cyclase
MDKSRTGEGAGRKQGKQRKRRRSTATETPAQPNSHTSVARYKLTRLHTNLADVQQGSTTQRERELREANEQLILAALHADMIAEKAVAHLNELAHSSQHDVLTGTPNRALMLDRLENAIAFARRHGKRIGVLFVDLNEFKRINDTLGHAAGDAVIQLVARRLESAVRHSDTVSRHGGDEFLVLLAEISQPSDAARVAEKILTGLAAPCRIDNHLIRLTASVGIAMFPEDGTDAATLITRADTAMYSCKTLRGSNFRFYRDAVASERRGRTPQETRDEPSSAGPPATMEALREANEQLVLAATTTQELHEQTKQKYARQIKFVAMVAHELRNLLVPMKTATGLLNCAHTEHVVEDAQELLAGQVAQISRFVEDLLDGARVGTGQFQLALSSVDIVDVVSRASEAFRAQIEARHQRLTISLPAGPLNIQGDAVRLAQIFHNLLDNASKYTPRGGRISLNGELSTNAIVITVSDNGVGIPAARLESIFDLFAHDQCQSAIHSGLGIGLAVVRDLVEAHGGIVVAHSAGENLGSEFSVTLPLRPGSPESEPSPLSLR